VCNNGCVKRAVVLTLMLIAAAIATGDALADQTAIGNLGKPDHVGTRTFTHAWPLSVPTGQCAGLPANLFFPAAGVPYTQMFKQWDNAFEVAPGSGIFLPWLEGVDTFAGATSVGGVSYAVHGIFFESRVAAADWGGFGKVFVTGSDGTHVSGDAFVGETPFPTHGVWVSWQGTPACK
jgi:hypothetical protein